MNTDLDFQQSGKQESFNEILKRLANTFKSFDWQFFRATTELQSWQDALEELRPIMT